MKQISTPNKLIQFIYRELSTTEMVDVRNRLNEDGAPSKEFQQLYDAYKELPKARFYPSQESLEYICNYSRESAVELSM